MPKHPVCIKTVVTADTAELIALSYGVRTENVLTGFKYIGEKIGKMQKRGESNNFVFGFEESCGYLTGSYVRDKDGVLAALLISEMVAFYKGNGTGVYEHLQSLYEKYGYEKNALCSYEFPGREGGEKIKEIMALIRKGTDNVGGLRVLTVKDYAEGIDGLPPTNAVKLFLERGCTLTVRPSGTEPKIKIYLSAMAQTPVEAEERASRIKEYIAEIFC